MKNHLQPRSVTFSENFQCKKLIIKFLYFDACKWGEAVNHCTKVFFFVSLKNVGNRTFQYDQSPLFFCAPFKIVVVVVVVVVVVGLVVWGRLGAASAVLETCVGQGRVPSPPPWMDPWVGALLTSISCTISSRFFVPFYKYFLFLSLSAFFTFVLSISCTIVIQFVFLLSNPCTISVWFISFLTGICCTISTYPTFYLHFYKYFPFPSLSTFYKFIGPRSDHSLRMSATHWMTDWGPCWKLPNVQNM